MKLRKDKVNSVVTTQKEDTLSEAEYNERSERLQAFLDDGSRVLGWESGFVKRRSKLTAARFVKLLVMGLLENGRASLQELVDGGAGLGVRISASGLAQRMGMSGVALLRGLVVKAVEELVNDERGTLGCLKGFSAVNIVDSTQISLPKGCASEYVGMGVALRRPAPKCRSAMTI